LYISLQSVSAVEGGLHALPIAIVGEGCTGKDGAGGRVGEGVNPDRTRSFGGQMITDSKDGCKAHQYIGYYLAL
jgi:hypothetical protein